MTSRSRRVAGSLAFLLSAASFAALAAATSESSTQGQPIEGILTVLNGDPDPASGRASQRIYVLNTDDGQRFELDLSQAASPKPMGLDRMRVRVIVDASLASLRDVAPRFKVLELQPLEVVSPLAHAK